MALQRESREAAGNVRQAVGEDERALRGAKNGDLAFALRGSRWSQSAAEAPREVASAIGARG